MGILPLQFLEGQTASTLGLTGREKYTINIPEDVKPGQIVEIEVHISVCAMCICKFSTKYLLCSQVCGGHNFKALLRFDTDVELAYFRHGGILNYMVRKLA